MKAVSPKQEIRYICKDDRKLPTEDQTTFVLTPLTVEQQAKLDDSIGVSTDDGFILSLGKSNLLALHLGLKSIENLPHPETGNLVELERDQTKSKHTLPGVGRPWTMDCIGLIPKEARDEIAGVIKEGGVLSEDEAKN